jgi:tellurite methyltransferase
MNLREWDLKYSGMDADAVDAPTPLVAKTVEGMKPGRALDLACGAGRNAVWLAGLGWRVTAVDASRAGIEVVRKRCGAVDARVADLEEHEFAIEADSWDLILMCLYMQRDLFEFVKRGVAMGGVVIATVLMGESRFSMAAGELRKQFDGWEILHSQEGAVAEIVAQKIGHK